MKDLTFWLVLADDDERYPVTGNITIGRHLDNDLMIAGEDVRDYHARVELTNRGLSIRPLADANIMVDGSAVEAVRALMPGDRVIIGHHDLLLEADGPTESVHWKLHPTNDSTGLELGERSMVGRGDECELQILEGHISREHATLTTAGNVVWLKDLNSSNGSYVNGERIVGAVRVYHGDELMFDISRYQLIGDHPDLTPVRPAGALPETFEFDQELTGTLETPATVTPLGRESVQEPGALPAAPIDGPVLVGLQGSLESRVFPLTFGRHLIGRAPEAEIHIPESSVSLRHAEIDVRADGIFITNLISTNGIQVNGKDVHISRLNAGDRLQLGRAVLQYQVPGAPESIPSKSTSARTLLLAVAVAALAGAILWWGFV